MFVFEYVLDNFFLDDGSTENADDFSDVTINIRELDDVLMKDVGKKIAESGKYIVYKLSPIVLHVY